MEKVKYFVEFLPRIQAVQVAVSATCKSRLSFYSNAIGFRKEDDACAEEKVFCSWKSPEVHIQSYIDLKVVSGEALHVRFKTESHLGASLRERGGGAVEFQDEFISAAENCMIAARCRFCRNCLTKPHYSFRRVLPLPSEVWRECSGELFCHDHGRSSHHPPSALLPKEGDCLVSGGSLLLRSCALSWDNITTVERGTQEEGSSSWCCEVVCRRCWSRLGERMDTGTQERNSEDDSGALEQCLDTSHLKSTDESFPICLQRARVSLERNGKEMKPHLHSFLRSPLPWGLENYLAKKIYATSQADMSFHFLVQDEAKQAYLQLWVLNVISTVACNSYPQGKESMFNNFSGYSIANSSAGELTSTVLKLLYKHTSVGGGEDAGEPTDGSRSGPPPPLGGERGVESLELTREECLWLVLLLANSNRTIPPSQRVVNGFRVGFLQVVR